MLAAFFFQRVGSVTYQSTIALPGSFDTTLTEVRAHWKWSNQSICWFSKVLQNFLVLVVTLERLCWYSWTLQNKSS